MILLKAKTIGLNRASQNYMYAYIIYMCNLINASIRYCKKEKWKDQKENEFVNKQ